MSGQFLEQKTVEVGGVSYLITALETMYGLGVMNHLMKLQADGEAPAADFMKSVIMKSVKVNNIQPTDEWFAKAFSRKYKDLYELFGEITKFNFETDEGEDPNAGVATSG